MRFMTPLLILLTLCIASAQLEAASSDKRDAITRSDGKTVRAYIRSETVGEIIYSSKKEGGSEQKLRWKDVKRWEYNAMKGGVWTGPTLAVFDGDYTTAIKQFAGVAGLIKNESDEWDYKEDWETTAEWKRAYGLFELGATYEKIGEHALAAASFARLAEKIPAHRLAIYSSFRQGVNLAMAGEDTAAALAGLKKFAGSEASTLANDLEKALNVISTANKGDAASLKKAMRDSGRLRTRFRENLDDWLYWRHIWAATLLKNEQNDKALAIYKEVYDRMENNPKRRATAAFALAKAQHAIGDVEGSFYLFMQLDVMPFVGKSDLAEARFLAGKHCVGRLSAAEGKEKERLTDMAKDLLAAVVRYAPGDSEFIVEAQTLIDEELAPKTDGDAAAEEKAEEEKAE